MKQLLFTFLINIHLFSIAQTQVTDSICEVYDQLIEQSLEEELDFYPAHISINSLLNKRAIGSVNHEITIYFDEYDEMEEDDEEFHKSATIRKVQFRISSGSYTISYTYYFDLKGELIKYGRKEVGYSCVDYQVYFENSQMIRVIQKELMSEDCLAEESIEEFDKSIFTKGEEDNAVYLLEQVEKYKEILRINYEIIKD